MTDSEMQKFQKSCGTRVLLDGKSCITTISDKTFYDKCIIYSEIKNKRIKDSVTWTPMDDDWKEQCKQNAFWFQDTLEAMKAMHPDMDNRLFNLRTKLLNFAGESVCLPAYEEDLDNLLKYGQFWIGNNVKFMKGEPCRCHANASNLWEQNKDKTAICTGYALSSDGMWRQHSWLLWRKPRSNQIVETTEPRIVYFGFAMPPDMCKEFADQNF